MNGLLDITEKSRPHTVLDAGRPETTAGFPSPWAIAHRGHRAHPVERRTRIVCTLGPASTDVGILRQLVLAGMDVARFNFSHGTHEFHRRTAAAVRQVAAELDRRVALMQDLQGPKLRIGALPGGPIELIEGDAVELRSATSSTEPATVPVPHRELVRALEPFDRVLFGDGEMELSVRTRSGESALCTVVHGGSLAEHKGIAVPGRYFPMPILGRKDLRDLDFGRSLGFDLLAISFVRTGADLDDVRTLTRERGWEVPLVAKLETSESLANLDAILARSDGVMVARGDLGVQLPLAAVPVAQKQIIRRANQSGIPVITATQMLESMVTLSRPTRAEATDVANAVWDGTDAVMLSAETSAGLHPVEAVRAMSDLCLGAESNSVWQRGTGAGWLALPDREVGVRNG